jgi:hypothetical protein
MSRRPADQARSALLRALEPHAAPCRLLSAASRDWASALFVGARHRLAIAIEGDDALRRADQLSRELGEIELAMRGGFVADITVLAQFCGGVPVLAIEALTIEEPEPECVSRAASRAG